MSEWSMFTHVRDRSDNNLSYGYWVDYLAAKPNGQPTIFEMSHRFYLIGQYKGLLFWLDGLCIYNFNCYEEIVHESLMLAGHQPYSQINMLEGDHRHVFTGQDDRHRTNFPNCFTAVLIQIDQCIAKYSKLYGQGDRCSFRDEGNLLDRQFPSWK